MSAYLEEHLPLLRSLHSSLGLPASALQEDETRIDAAIKAVVVSIVRERENEVENWKEAISLAKKDVMCIGRALGDRSVGKVDDENDPLPQQHEKLLLQRERLETAYNEQLRRIEALQSALTALATLLGAPYEAPKPLQPIAGTSNPLIQQHQQRTSLGRVVSNSGTSFKPDTAGSKKRSNVGLPDFEGPRAVWMDLGGQVLETLESDLKKAVDERDNRRRQLIEAFVHLRWLHYELALPPLPMAQPHHFPVNLLPSRMSEEVPGAHAGYEKLLAKFMTANPQVPEEDGIEIEEKGLEDLQPELGLIAWVNEVQDLWNRHKEACEERIQELFNLIEPHWNRLPEVDQNFMDAFFDVNRGSGEAAIKAYEAELERVLELRRASLSTFMTSIREEIEGLWIELMFGDDEKDQFIGFIDDDFTEELLKAHEEYVELLRSEIESKSTLLPKVREWHALVADEEELDRTANDPNRFKMRGGAMLREEKLRKRVSVLKPKVENELLNSIPRWEDENKRPFMVQGERVVDKIQDAIDAKEAAKEAKKRARQGLGPTKTVKATPTIVHARPQTTGMANRKRAAPEATPLHGYGGVNKRSRVEGFSTTKPRIRPSTASIQDTFGRRQVPKALGSDLATPIPCGLPRPTASTTYRSLSNPTNVSLFSTTNQNRIPSNPYKIAPQTSSLSLANLSKADGRKPRRQSFRPRQSVLPSRSISDLGAMGIADADRGKPGWDLGELAEDEPEGLYDQNVVGIDQEVF